MVTPVLLLFAAMFIMIVIIGTLFLQHLRDHEKEEQDANEFAQKILDRMNTMIEEKLNETEKGSG